MFSGFGYVSRIRDPSTAMDVHKQQDLMHGIMYIDEKENIDYLDIRKVIEDNKLTFYTNRIDKSKSGFTFGMGLDGMAKHKPVGEKCLMFHEHPLSGMKMLELAYAENILTDDTGIKFLQSKKVGSMAPTSSSQLSQPSPRGPAGKVDLLLKQVDEEIIDLLDNKVHHEETEVGGTQVVGDHAGKEKFLSLEYWRERALKAETRALASEEQVQKDEDIISGLQASLRSSTEAKIRFSASADLAQTREREFQAYSASPIIEGLKPQLDKLPQVLDLLKDVASKLDKLADVPVIVENMKSVSDTVKKYHEDLENASTVVNDKEEGSEVEMETLLCHMQRLVKIYERFGFSSSVEPVDMPQTIVAIRSLLSSSDSASLIGNESGRSSGQFILCPCGCGQQDIDVTKPPPTGFKTGSVPVGGSSSGTIGDVQLGTSQQGGSFLQEHTMNNNYQPRGSLTSFGTCVQQSDPATNSNRLPYIVNSQDTRHQYQQTPLRHLHNDSASHLPLDTTRHVIQPHQGHAIRGNLQHHQGPARGGLLHHQGSASTGGQQLHHGSVACDSAGQGSGQYSHDNVGHGGQHFGNAQLGLAGHVQHGSGGRGDMKRVNVPNHQRGHGVHSLHKRGRY